MSVILYTWYRKFGKIHFKNIFRTNRLFLWEFCNLPEPTTANQHHRHCHQRLGMVPLAIHSIKPRGLIVHSRVRLKQCTIFWSKFMRMVSCPLNLCFALRWVKHPWWDSFPLASVSRISSSSCGTIRHKPPFCLLLFMIVHWSNTQRRDWVW